MLQQTEESTQVQDTVELSNAASAVHSSELLRQILMVGSLFNSRVFQQDATTSAGNQQDLVPDSEDSEEAPVNKVVKRA